MNNIMYSEMKHSILLGVFLTVLLQEIHRTSATDCDHSAINPINNLGLDVGAANVQIEKQSYEYKEESSDSSTSVQSSDFGSTDLQSQLGNAQSCATGLGSGLDSFSNSFGTGSLSSNNFDSLSNKFQAGVSDSQNQFSTAQSNTQNSGFDVLNTGLGVNSGITDLKNQFGNAQNIGKTCGSKDTLATNFGVKNSGYDNLKNSFGQDFGATATNTQNQFSETYDFSQNSGYNYDSNQDSGIDFYGQPQIQFSGGKTDYLPSFPQKPHGIIPGYAVIVEGSGESSSESKSAEEKKHGKGPCKHHKKPRKHHKKGNKSCKCKTPCKCKKPKALKKSKCGKCQKKCKCGKK